MDQHSLNLADVDNQPTEQQPVNLADVNYPRQPQERQAVNLATVSLQRQTTEKQPVNSALVAQTRPSDQQTNRLTDVSKTTNKQSANLQAIIQPRDPKGECVCVAILAVMTIH